MKLGGRVECYKLGDRVLLLFVENPIDGIGSAWGGYSEYAVIGDRAAAAMIITFREVLLGIKSFGMKSN